MRLSRRSVLKAALSFPAAAWAFGDTSRFIPAVAQHGGRWNARLSGLRRLVWEIVATDPRELGCPHDEWTATHLMQYLRRANLIDGLSYESVRQLFKEAQVVVGRFGSRPVTPSVMSRPLRERESRPVFMAAGTT